MLSYRKKSPNMESNSWSSIPGPYPLTIRLSGTHPKGAGATSPFPRLGKRVCGTFHFGPVPDSLIPDSRMVRGYEPGREDREFNPKLGKFFLYEFLSI